MKGRWDAVLPMQNKGPLARNLSDSKELDHLLPDARPCGRRNSGGKNNPTSAPKLLINYQLSQN